MKKSIKTPVVFLDRDGVLIKRAELTWKKSQLELQDGVVDFIKFLNKNNILVIVITNQPVVARGLITERGVKELHEILQKRLKQRGAYIDRFYFCPHHPNATLPKYRKKCDCRKPKIGMYKQVARDFSIDFKKSFTIGDMTQDILAGKRAKTKTILFLKGHGGKDGKYKVKPHRQANNFREVFKFFKKYEFS
ncbi:MAG: HAD family hydrolase [Patescibacteria group bacterium]